MKKNYDFTNLKNKKYVKQFAFVLLTILSVSMPALANEDAEIAFWNSVEKMDTFAGYTAYLEQYPNGKFAKLAAIKIKSALRSEPSTAAPNTSTPSEPVQSKTITVPGVYNATFTWEKAEYNSYGGKPKFICNTQIVIDNKFIVKEKKISCPGWQGYTEWYYRGEFDQNGKVKNFKVNHAYGRGEYFLKGDTKILSPKKISTTWWNLHIKMEKSE